MKLSESIRRSAPISEALANEMFEFVFDACHKYGCEDGEDHATAFRFTCEFCRSHGLDADEIIPWLESFGAYCDGDLLLNVSIWFLPSDLFDPDSDPEVDEDDQEDDGDGLEQPAEAVR